MNEIDWRGPPGSAEAAPLILLCFFLSKTVFCNSGGDGDGGIGGGGNGGPGSSPGLGSSGSVSTFSTINNHIFYGGFWGAVRVICQSLVWPSDFFRKFYQNVKKTVCNPANSQNLLFSSSIMLLKLPKSTKRKKINEN